MLAAATFPSASATEGGVLVSHYTAQDAVPYGRRAGNARRDIVELVVP